MEKALSLLLVSIKPLNFHSAVAFVMDKKLEGDFLDLFNPYKKENHLSECVVKDNVDYLIDEMYVMIER